MGIGIWLLFLKKMWKSFFILDADGKGMPKVNRAKIREMAERSHNYIKLVEASGGNKHSAELDVNDAVVEMLTKIMLSELKVMPPPLIQLLQKKNWL
jgi:hypothetical protein